MKLIRTLVFLLAIALSTHVIGYAQHSKSDLAPTVRQFFETWMLKRDIPATLSYLSRNPILGQCMMSDELEKKPRLTHADVVGAYEEFLSAAQGEIKPGADLSSLITSSSANVIPRDEALMINNSEPKYFTIYRLKPLDPSDNGYVCKFDERKLFRKAISAPGLFYVFTKVKLQPKSEAFILLSVWKKEKRTWRILTLSVDQD